MPWSNLSIQNLILENEVEKQEQRRVKLHDLLWDCTSLSDPPNPAPRKQGRRAGRDSWSGCCSAQRRRAHLPSSTGSGPTAFRTGVCICVVCSMWIGREKNSSLVKNNLTPENLTSAENQLQHYCAVRDSHNIQRREGHVCREQTAWHSPTWRAPGGGGTMADSGGPWGRAECPTIRFCWRHYTYLPEPNNKESD